VNDHADDWPHNRVHMSGEARAKRVMTVWICIDTSKQVGDINYVEEFGERRYGAGIV
jgi:hypothetical protein